MRYLIVDDSPTVRVSLASLLKVARPWKSDIVEAGDAKEALAKLPGAPFECVFLDMMLASGAAGQTGGAVLEKILAHDHKSRVVLVTGLPRNDPAVEKAIMLGAFAYIRKPVHLKDLRHVLDLIDQDAGRMKKI